MFKTLSINQGNKTIMNKKQQQIVSIAAIAILILSIVPMLWIGQYLHPFADDYVFGANVYKTWNESHSFLACIQSAWNVAISMYHSWQGTYSACFLMALQPGVFGQYWLGPIILLFSLMGSTYALLYMAMRKLLHVSRLEYIFVATLFVTITIQFTYSYYDAFFWYNGAMYYTLFYSLSLMLASLLIGYRLASTRARKTMIGVTSVVLAIIIAGGNFVSGLGMGALLFTSIIIMRIEQKRWPRFYLVILAVYGVAFTLSVLAPGNAYRQITIEDKPNVVAAFFMAIGKSFEFLSDSFNIVKVLMLTVITPAIVRMAAKSRFKFSHPWLCVIVTVLLYSSFFFAHSYAMGTRGPGRVQNIYSYVSLWLVCVNVFYLSGALIRKAEAKAPLSSAIVEVAKAFQQKYAHTLRFAPYYVVVIFILSVSIKQTTTNRTVTLMKKRTVYKFDKEMRERELALTADDRSRVKLKPLSVKMPSDAFNDITVYSGYWINQGLARYYGKEEIEASYTPKETTESPSMLLARCKRDVGPGNLKFINFR